MPTNEDAPIPDLPPQAQSWHGKYPGEMTDEELRYAKQYVSDELEPLQKRLMVLSNATANLDFEINVRFRMGNHTVVSPTTLPDYPVAALGVEA